VKRYVKGVSHLLCGHWNGSPVEIGLGDRIRHVPRGEVRHYHAYHEYYLVLEGRGSLEVEGETVPLEPNSLVMVEPGERHRVVWVDPEQGLRWVIVKQVSAADSKTVVPED
jgi:mannose-6-phosphate isomerase-like protein (cupin superfamily)